MKFPSKQGFTLIELLVVVLIIGILAAVALPQYQKAVLRAHYAQLQTVVKSLADAEQVYYLTHGTWAQNLAQLDVTLPLNISADYSFSTWFNTNFTSGVIAGSYKGRIQYLQNLIGQKSRECRALETDTIANSVCQTLGGKYVATYSPMKAYKLP